MHIALVNPCYPHRKARYDPGMNPGVFAPPLGLAYLAAPLLARGHHVDLLDLSLNDQRPDEGADRLLELDPDLIGLSCNMAFNCEMALRVGRRYRAEGGPAPIVAGGNHATFEHCRLLTDEPSLDFVIRGEGEMVLPVLADALAEGTDPSSIPGISVRDGQCIRTNPGPRPVHNLDRLLPPARALLSLNRFGADSRGLLIGSRGCPFACAYCSTSAFAGNRFRTHSIARMLSEARELVEAYGVRHLLFVDDTFTLNRQRAQAFCKALKEAELEITWACDTRVDLVDRKLLEQMADAGCTSIFFGIESVNQQALDTVGKGFTVEQAERACLIAADAGIEVQQSFIIGLPGETAESIGGIIDFVRRTGPARVLLNFFTAYPGTAVHQTPEAFGIHAYREDWPHAEQANPMVLTNGLSRQALLRCYVDLVFELRASGVLKW